MRKIASALAASMPPMTAVPMTLRATAARAAREPERHAAEDEREGGHQDRPQADLGPLERGVEERDAVLVAGPGELDDQDGVLRREADQHDEADLGEDVVLHARRSEERGYAPKTATGTPSRTLKGSDQLS